MARTLSFKEELSADCWNLMITGDNVLGKNKEKHNVYKHNALSVCFQNDSFLVYFINRNFFRLSRFSQRLMDPFAAAAATAAALYFQFKGW